MARKKIKFDELENEIQTNTTQKKIVLENVQDINDTRRNVRPIFVEPNHNPTTSKWLVISLAIFAAGVLILLVIVNSGPKQTKVQKAANNYSKNANIVSPAAPQNNSHFTITIKSQPRATFSIDEEDQPRGRTPFTISLDNSHDGLGHVVHFEAEGYKMKSEVIKDGQKDLIVTLD